jgi:hypothetical protein
MALKINYYFESLICRKSLLTHFKNIEKIMKESNFETKSHSGHFDTKSHSGHFDTKSHSGHFDTKSHSGHFEELNHVVQEAFVDLHEIEPVVMVHVNAMLWAQFLYQSYQCYLRSRCCNVRTRHSELQKNLTLKDYN